MLKYRLITGPILIAVLLGFILADQWLEHVPLSEFWSEIFADKQYPPKGIALYVLCLIAIPFASWELCRICQAQGIATRLWLTTFAAMLGLTLSYSIPTPTPISLGVPAHTAVAIVSTGLIFVFVTSLFTFSQNKNVQGIVAAAGAVVFAMVYLGFMFGFFLALRRHHSAWWIVGIVLIIKSCDTGAYFTGRAIGRHKLIPWLSPGKTWEGLAGGIALAILVAILLALLNNLAIEQAWIEGPTIPMAFAVICGIIFAIVGQLGDLAKSLLKRGAGFKDSSTLLPGLGGVLDVLDSPLMVAPVAYWLITLLLPAMQPTG